MEIRKTEFGLLYTPWYAKGRTIRYSGGMEVCVVEAIFVVYSSAGWIYFVLHRRPQKIFLNISMYLLQLSRVDQFLFFFTHQVGEVFFLSKHFNAPSPSWISNGSPLKVSIKTRCACVNYLSSERYLIFISTISLHVKHYPLQYTKHVNLNNYLWELYIACRRRYKITLCDGWNGLPSVLLNMLKMSEGDEIIMIQIQI